MSKIKVLFVDDEINVINSLKRGLIYENFTCRFANSGKEALEILEKEEIAVVVTDMRMPEMNGLVLMKHIEEAYPQVVKIVLSGYTQLTQVIATINQVDIFKFITKPWKLEEEFIEAINKAIAYYVMKKENEDIRKALGVKNQAYVNIFKTITDSIQGVKKSREVVVECGESIFLFNQMHLETIRNNLEEVMAIEYKIYTLICEAAQKEEVVWTGKQLVNGIKAGINSQVEIKQIEMSPEFIYQSKSNYTLIIAIAMAYTTLFRDLLSTNDFHIHANITSEGVYHIAFISPNRYDEKASSSERVIQTIDEKIMFHDAILRKLAVGMGCDFICMRKQGNLVGILSLAPPDISKNTDG